MYVVQLPAGGVVKYFSPWAKRVFSASSFFLSDQPFIVVFQRDSEVLVVEAMKFERPLYLMSSFEEAQKIDQKIPQLAVLS